MRFTIGKVLGLCFATIGACLWPMLAVTVLLSYVVTGLVMLGTWGLSFALGLQAEAVGWLSMISLPVTYIFAAAQWSAITDITLQNVIGKPVVLSDVLRRSVSNALPVLGIGLLWLLGVMIGFSFLIIPGTIFILVFLVTVPAYIHEKPGIFGAFTRSRELTRNHRWGLFGFNLLVNSSLYAGFFIVVIALSLVSGAGMSSAPVGEAAPLNLIVIGGTIILFTILSIFIPTLNTSLYVALRAEKRQPVTGSVENIFE